MDWPCSRKYKDDISKIALRWTPEEGKRKRRRPKETWQRTIKSELRIIGMTCGEAERKTQDRQHRRAVLVSSCASTNNVVTRGYVKLVQEIEAMGN